MPEITPCDYIRIPVYATYKSEKGIRADRGMFADCGVIVLRWQDTDRQRQTLVFRPFKWYDGKNYFLLGERRWKYE